MNQTPNFFIVGAPKCGTTAMNDYLSQHPEVFVPDIKEVHFFGSDLHFTKGALRDEGAYRALFAGATQPRRGEASVWYLYSRTAAAEIHAFSPDAKIIVMLRNPAEMLYSQHSQFLYNGNEDLTDFWEALAAEPERRAGRRVPVSAHLVDGLFYSETVKYAEQLGRYFDTFGRENVHVILYDDFRADLPGTYRETLRFWVYGTTLRPSSRSSTPTNVPAARFYATSCSRRRRASNASAGSFFRAACASG